MDSNSRQYIVIGGRYVEQGPTAPKYRAILPKQPGVPRILKQQPLTTANFKLLTYNLQPTPPAELEADISEDPHLKDANMVQIKTQSTGTSKVISLRPTNVVGSRITKSFFASTPSRQRCLM